MRLIPKALSLPSPGTMQKANQIHRECEERFRFLVESVQDYAIFMLDPSGHVASWNLEAERTEDYTTDEILGKYFFVFYRPEDIQNGKPARDLTTAKEQGRLD
jgi:PAS domain S-box-containing protein